MPNTLDISKAQHLAIDDYLTHVPMRYTCDFLTSSAECRLCGHFTEHHTRHAHGSAHRRAVHEYNMTMKELNIVDRECYVRNDGPVSAREVVLNYLQGKVTRADGVANVQPFHEAAMAFMNGLTNSAVLLEAYQAVRGTERKRQRGTCVVCMERPSTMMYSGCKHICTCMACSLRMKSHAEDATNLPCPICRQVSATVAVYIS